MMKDGKAFEFSILTMNKWTQSRDTIKTVIACFFFFRLYRRLYSHLIWSQPPFTPFQFSKHLFSALCIPTIVLSSRKYTGNI